MCGWELAETLESRACRYRSGVGGANQPGALACEWECNWGCRGKQMGQRSGMACVASCLAMRCTYMDVALCRCACVGVAVSYWHKAHLRLVRGAKTGVTYHGGTEGLVVLESSWQGRADARSEGGCTWVTGPPRSAPGGSSTSLRPLTPAVAAARGRPAGSSCAGLPPPQTWPEWPPCPLQPWHVWPPCLSYGD